jgi:hypothetical protein
VDVSKTPTVAHLASTSMKVRSACNGCHQFIEVVVQVEVALTNALSATSDIIATSVMSWEFYHSKGGVKACVNLRPV